MGDQAEGLRRMLQMPHQQKHAKTIAVASGKGGVGKSNISLNLSLELINRNKKVLLFDLDIGMGNIDVLLGLDTTYSFVDLFEQDIPITDIIATGPKGLSYISGGRGLNRFFVVDEAKKALFFNTYEELVKTYDYIILDMGAGATADSLLFILAADECFIVTTPEPPSITDAYSMIKHIVGHGFTKPISILMNRSVNEKRGIAALNNFRAVVKQFLQIDVTALGVLPDDKIVTKSVMRQTPFLLMNDKAPISKAIKHTVDYYLSNLTKPPNSRSLSFVSKLKQLMMER
ncbi:MinD/ParA family protein [Lentibacillus saliphilus]|uniref:MinD/ParA family protein n=1 Tax=Lentibacillus saliphilus TaxID=2737028 RepID=UPI001C303D7C|nr:MinD/ParA family protein [Lentibacillus saliphilus]